jgi:hypothetical protein
MKLTFRNSYLNAFSLALIIGLIGYFYFQFFCYTSNIPVNDDYKAILEFLNKFKGAGSLSERASLIFSQHNEHRIVYDHLWTLICYKIYGAVNFNFLSLIGNLSYFGVFVVLSIPFYKKGLIYLVPIAVLVFNFSFHENMTFPMATLSNNTGLLFCLMSIYFAPREKYAYLGVVFYLLAIFTVGSGLFLTVLLPAIFLYNKQRKLLWIFVAVAIVALAFYFIGYEKPPQTPSIVETILHFKVRAILFFLSFVGSALGFNLIFTGDLTDSMIVATLAGLAITIVYGYAIYKKWYKGHEFIFSVLTFVLLTAAFTSVSRTILGLDTAIASRYRLYSAVALIACYYYFAEHVKLKQNVRYAIIVVASGFYFVNISLPQLEYLDYRQNLNYLGAVNYLSGNHKMLNGFEQDAYKVILEDSQNYQVYTLPEVEINGYYPFSTQVETLSQSNNSDKWFTQGIEQVYELEDSFLIFGKGFLDNEPSNGQAIYLEMESDQTKNKLTFQTTQVRRYDMNPYFKTNNLDYGGFCCRIKKTLLDDSEYTIRLAIFNGKLFKKETTDKKIKKTF